FKFSTANLGFFLEYHDYYPKNIKKHCRLRSESLPEMFLCANENRMYILIIGIAAQTTSRDVFFGTDGRQ
ncbi:MAG: hypothetical protein IJ140_03245, partial [Prevotella sp.]|nr:hypothetical protein [Prevotella sp.]